METVWRTTPHAALSGLLGFSITSKFYVDQTDIVQQVWELNILHNRQIVNVVNAGRSLSLFNIRALKFKIL